MTEHLVVAKIETILDVEEGEHSYAAIAELKQELEDKGWDVSSIKLNPKEVELELG